MQTSMTDALVFAVVEDDPPSRRLIATLLAAEGDVVVEAATMAQARTIIREYPWDIAIIDRGLPDGDGLDLCREIANEHRGGHRHVIIVSALSGHHQKMCGYEVGADDYIVKPFDVTELRAKLNAVRRAVAHQKALVSRLAVMEQLSVIDSLTHLYNRRFFDNEMSRLFDITVRHARPLGLVIADIDHFKLINDGFGHGAGDIVLQEVSNVIAQVVRSTDVLVRYGGEEFAVILPETRLESAATLADRVRKAVEELQLPPVVGAGRVTVSLGVAAAPNIDIVSPSQLVEAADRALYLAKTNGRNRVEPDSKAVPRTRVSGPFGNSQVRL
jgi:diguanylate cyclase (GGDEF)-like protein